MRETELANRPFALCGPIRSGERKRHAGCWAVLTLALVACTGCTISKQTKADLAWRVFPGYERIPRPCCLVVPDSVRQFVVRKSSVNTYRFQLGDSLASSLPRALSRLFAEVSVVSNETEVPARSGDPVIIKITSVDGSLSVPPSNYSKARADISFDVEIICGRSGRRITERFRASADSLNDYDWLQDLANGTVQGAGNDLLQFLVSNRARIMGD